MSSSDKKIVLLADMMTEQACCELYGDDSTMVPSEDERQKDLQYIAAVLVSSGMNLNGAVFLPSELIQARDTMIRKPLDVEHLEGYVVGHIYGRTFMKQDGTIVSPTSLLVEEGTNVDSLDLDIAVTMALYKYRFPEIAEDVEEGKYKVSMECYYSDFDIKIGDIIISQTEASKLGIDFTGKDSVVGKNIKVTEGNKDLGTAQIGRVFRNIMFSGCGLVENPAEIRADIFEVASRCEASNLLNGGTIIDLSKSDTYMKEKYDDNKIELTDVDSEPEEDNKEVAGSGPASPNAGYCVSYKKYYYVYEEGDDVEYDQEHPPHINTVPGLGGDPTPDHFVKHEHWCSLFETTCTSVGADATYPSCLRNVLNSATKDAIADYQDLYDGTRYNVDWETFRKAKQDALDVINKADEALVKKSIEDRK